MIRCFLTNGVMIRLCSEHDHLAWEGITNEASQVVVHFKKRCYDQVMFGARSHDLLEGFYTLEKRCYDQVMFEIECFGLSDCYN